MVAMGGSDRGLQLGCVDFNHVVLNFVEHCESGVLASFSQRGPSELVQHVCDTRSGVVFSEAVPGCSPLHALQFVDVLLCVGVPCSACIFQCWANKTRVCFLFD